MGGGRLIAIGVSNSQRNKACCLQVAPSGVSVLELRNELLTSANTQVIGLIITGHLQRGKHGRRKSHAEYVCLAVCSGVGVCVVVHVSVDCQ